MVAAKLGEQPQFLRPYLFHRVELNWAGDADAVGTCPFCDRDGKFFVSQKTGQYSCKTCPKEGGSGNVYTFIRRLHSISSARVADLELVAEERRVSVETLQRWGLVQSAIDREWMLPTFSVTVGQKTGQREINNLYRWSMIKGKRRLLTTATLSHGLFGLQFWDDRKTEVYVNEGPWDGQAFSEVLMKYRRPEVSKLVRTVDVASSLYGSANVVAVPGCEVFRDDWVPLFKGKYVTFLYDNDHPRFNRNTQQTLPPAGLEGVKMAAKKVASVAASVSYLEWGSEGYDNSLSDGYDVRDFLNESAAT